MAKRYPESGGRWRNFLILLIVTCTCAAVYVAFAPLFRIPYSSTSSSAWQKTMEPMDGENKDCCRGIEHMELWAEAVNWGSDFLVNSTQECCKACKANKRCNSWVYCGDSMKCGSMYRQVRTFVFFSLSLPKCSVCASIDWASQWCVRHVCPSKFPVISSSYRNLQRPFWTHWLSFYWCERDFSQVGYSRCYSQVGFCMNADLLEKQRFLPEGFFELLNGAVEMSPSNFTMTMITVLSS